MKKVNQSECKKEAMELRNRDQPLGCFLLSSSEVCACLQICVNAVAALAVFVPKLANLLPG
jgi:hypothetical protein